VVREQSFSSLTLATAPRCSIKPITDKRYPYLIVGGISTEPINRRLAVARDHGMDVIDIVSKKTAGGH
jgi:hypothetical protein